MKVLKFGGTSVGTVDSLRNVKSIVERCPEQVIVVVSALGGLTDRLIATAKMAEKGDDAFRTELDAMIERHRAIVEMLVPEEKRGGLYAEIDPLFKQLHNVYYGISLLEELSPRSLDKVVSFGERLSARIISRIIDSAVFFDSLKFVKTLRRFDKNVLDSERTLRLIDSEFGGSDFKVAVVPGFISTDVDGHITNLGRGGSDYTAAILAAALNADSLEIWTDVDGFMTADPRIISGTRVIPQLSFTEAMELCNFGAKVIYPPTIYPVFHKNIPIYIKNTFNPSAPGTCIKDEKVGSIFGTTVKGVSSIVDTCLLTVRGRDRGCNPEGRALNTLARNGVSVLLVSHTQPYYATSFSIGSNDIERACEVIGKEFAAELETGEVEPLAVEKKLATIAIVGDDMKSSPEIADKLIESVKRADIELCANSQGVPETSMAFVVALDDRVKALQVAHDCFFG